MNLQTPAGSPPRFSESLAQQVALEHFGIVGRARALPSERDQNFLIQTDRDERFVLKFANKLEGEPLVALQQAAMRHASRQFALIPQLVMSTAGGSTAKARDVAGVEHTAWCITCIDGVPLGALSHQSGALLEDLGRQTALLNKALADFTSPALEREFVWDLRHATATIGRLLPLVDDERAVAHIRGVLGAYTEQTAARLAALPQQAIHGDINDWNVLVAPAVGGTPSDRVAAILDFGDLVSGWRASELAVAITYAMLDKDAPLSAAAHVVRGFHAESALSEREIGALFGLACMRASLSICIGEAQRRANPDNRYLSISDSQMRRLLSQLSAIPFAMAEAVFRDACGLEPVRSSAAVREWLRAHTHEFAQVLGGHDLTRDPVLVLDLGVASDMVEGDAAHNVEPRLTERVFGRMRAEGVRVSVGRYDEPRLLYTAPFFSIPGEVTTEWRTIHIGLDLFAEAGTPVHAPLDGTVYAFANNAVAQDYGPVIILRHITDDGVEFFTLYGHLSRGSLAGLREGAVIRRGERFATLGTADENVGWTPHLHLQIITDLLGIGTDFPGVGDNTHRNVWRSLSPDPNLLVGVPSAAFGARASAAEALARRARHMGASVRVGYRKPLHASRGWMQFIHDDGGRRYLDAFNNVPHVGHSHPRVVDAVSRQLRILNTNTRYPHAVVSEYARRLAATLPAPLDVCFLVNSGSEANELAVRLARGYTGARHTIVLEGAYHGNTTTCIDLSPYKHSGPGGRGRPAWVHAVPQPDDYRGEYSRADGDAGRKYAAYVSHVIARLSEAGEKLCAFLAETCPSVGGQILPPEDYYQHVYALVRAAGGVCIADEVQTGFGRMGDVFWAFESYNVVPDIVVMGKPIGNGYPLGAVVTTRQIADTFNNGMEFFSTFGGSTASCTAGLAVLDVLRDEELQRRALETGATLGDALREIADRRASAGDVRGRGLFWGVELVKDGDSREPAGAEASYVVERMRELGVLIGTDGPFHNVLKIRPPMQFNRDDALVLAARLDRVLGEL